MTENTGDTTDEGSTSDRQGATRRGLLAAGVTFGTAGCLGLLSGGGGGGTPGGSGTPGTYTTIPGTTTFAQLTGERTPYIPVQPTRIGNGKSMAIFFDYAQPDSIEWWRETYPKIRDEVEDGPIQVSLSMYPVPLSRWSVMVPCALFAAKHASDNSTAVDFHRRLIEIAPDYTISRLRDAAEAVGVDPTVVERAARDRVRRSQVFAGRSFARKQGIESPPAAAAEAGTRVLPDTRAETILSAYETETDG